MSAVFRAADQAVMGPLGEHNYRFLKILTQVLYCCILCQSNERYHFYSFISLFLYMLFI